MTKTLAELAALPANEQRGWLALELMTVLNAAKRATLKDAVRA